MNKNTEPVITALFVNLTVAVLAVLVSFGVDLSAEQRAAIVGLVTAVCSVVTAIWARGKVTPA